MECRDGSGDFFCLPNATAILNLPRPRVVCSDFWAWEGENSGVFSMRSAYRMLMERKVAQNQLPGSSIHGESVWKALWKLRVQPKIRYFGGEL